MAKDRDLTTGRLMRRCEQSTVAMTSARLFNVLMTPFSVVFGVILRLYRAIFWSDARWIRYRVYMTETNDEVEKFFRHATEQELKQLIGFELQFKLMQKGEENEPKN